MVKSAKEFIERVLFRWHSFLAGVGAVIAQFALSDLAPSLSSLERWLIVGSVGLVIVVFLAFHRVRQERDSALLLPKIEVAHAWVRELLDAYEKLESPKDYPEWEGGLRGAGGCLHELETSFAREIRRTVGRKAASELAHLADIFLGPPLPGMKAESGFPHKLRQADVLLTRWKESGPIRGSGMWWSPRTPERGTR